MLVILNCTLLYVQNDGWTVPYPYLMVCCTNICLRIVVIHRRNDSDLTYLRFCPVRAWFRLRCLEGARECDGYAV